jgi:ubiquinol-cytochrome c reductase cytochrome b subunit
MSLTFYLVLLLAGGNDIIASIFHLSINEITYTLRTALFVVPPIVYVITKRFCLSLQRADDDLLHHGIESGTIRRLPSGEFVEETVGVPHVYTTLLATTDERRHAIEHQHHTPITATRQPGVEAASAEEHPQLETTTD